MLVKCRCYPPDFVWCLFFHISYWAAMLGCRFLVCSGFSDRYIFLHTVFICVCILNMFQAWFTVHCEDWSLSSSCLVWLLLGCRFLVCFGETYLYLYILVVTYLYIYMSAFIFQTCFKHGLLFIVQNDHCRHLVWFVCCSRAPSSWLSV